jgi:hypothetical protein
VFEENEPTLDKKLYTYYDIHGAIAAEEFKKSQNEAHAFRFQNLHGVL